MATCKECLHFRVCGGYIPSDLDKDVWDLCRQGKADEIPDIEERCSSFTYSTEYVKVVRCKDCKHFGPFAEPYNKAGLCRVIVGIHRENDFCSCGEVRANER